MAHFYIAITKHLMHHITTAMVWVHDDGN
jgi:hypothetical protein